MLDEKFVILAALFNFIGGGSYVLLTLKGKVKPNKVTWFIWSLAPMVAFSAEIQQGVGLRSLMTFMVGFMPFLVFVSSFINKKAYWKVNKLDVICGALSMLGLVFWQITKVGNLAILFSILADGLAGVPTIIKAYQEPQTENSTVFLFAAISALITLMTVDVWNFEHYAFPLYIFVICLLISILALRVKWKKID